MRRWRVPQRTACRRSPLPIWPISLAWSSFTRRRVRRGKADHRLRCLDQQRSRARQADAPAAPVPQPEGVSCVCPNCSPVPGWKTRCAAAPRSRKPGWPMRVATACWRFPAPRPGISALRWRRKTARWPNVWPRTGRSYFPRCFYIELQRAGAAATEHYIQRALALAGRMALPVVATHPVQFLAAR